MAAVHVAPTGHQKHTGAALPREALPALVPGFQPALSAYCAAVGLAQHACRSDLPLPPSARGARSRYKLYMSYKFAVGHLSTPGSCSLFVVSEDGILQQIDRVVVIMYDWLRFQLLRRELLVQRRICMVTERLVGSDGW